MFLNLSRLQVPLWIWIQGRGEVEAVKLLLLFFQREKTVVESDRFTRLQDHFHVLACLVVELLSGEASPDELIRYNCGPCESGIGHPWGLGEGQPEESGRNPTRLESIADGGQLPTTPWCSSTRRL